MGIMRIFTYSLVLVMLFGGLSGCSFFKKNDTTRDDQLSEVPTEYYPGEPESFDLPPNTEPALPEMPRPVGLRPAQPLHVIHFDFDRYNIRPDQIAQLEMNVSYLKENPQTKVLIEGHCDERGTTEYNFVLGERRADAVRDYFTQAGISPNRLQMLSKGEEQPLTTESNEAAWARNRRVEFQFFD